MRKLLYYVKNKNKSRLIFNLAQRLNKALLCADIWFDNEFIIKLRVMSTAFIEAIMQ